jgi:hypothetical protein
LASNEAAKKQMEAVPLEAIHELVDVSHLIARGSAEDYLLVAENVVESAFRRTAQKKLERCASLCGNMSVDIRQEIYTLDSAMLEFATTNDAPQFRDVVEGIWADIERGRAAPPASRSSSPRSTTTPRLTAGSFSSSPPARKRARASCCSTAPWISCGAA